MNKVILIGNLGQDPEVKETKGGTSVASISLATNERVKKGDAWEDHTEWHRVVCFGSTAENLGKYKKKGDPLYVEGRLRTRKWQDKDGVDKFSTEIVADVVQYGVGR